MYRWRWLFVVEGVATIGVAIIALFVLLDFPSNSKALSQRERDIAIVRLQDGGVRSHTEDGPRIGKGKSFILALTDVRVIGFIFGYMVPCLCRTSLSVY
jgi:hypothetical protein